MVEREEYSALLRLAEERQDGGRLGHEEEIILRGGSESSKPEKTGRETDLLLWEEVTTVTTSRKS